jgi:hypothetical protein
LKMRTSNLVRVRSVAAGQQAHRFQFSLRCRCASVASGPLSFAASTSAGAVHSSSAPSSLAGLPRSSRRHIYCASAIMIEAELGCVIAVSAPANELPTRPKDTRSRSKKLEDDRSSRQIARQRWLPCEKPMTCCKDIRWAADRQHLETVGPRHRMLATKQERQSRRQFRLP